MKFGVSRAYVLSLIRLELSDSVVLTQCSVPSLQTLIPCAGERTAVSHVTYLNGKVLVIEIKSSLDRGAVYQFVRKVEFYTRKTGRQVDRKLIVTPYADARAQNVSAPLGVEICTDVVGLR